MQPDAPRWSVDGQCVLCSGSTCHSFEFDLVLRNQDRGVLRIGPVLFAISGGQASPAFWDQVLSSLFPDEAAERHAG